MYSGEGGFSRIALDFHGLPLQGNFEWAVYRSNLPKSRIFGKFLEDGAGPWMGQTDLASTMRYLRPARGVKVQAHCGLKCPRARIAVRLRSWRIFCYWHCDSAAWIANEPRSCKLPLVRAAHFAQG